MIERSGISDEIVVELTRADPPSDADDREVEAEDDEPER